MNGKYEIEDGTLFLGISIPLKISKKWTKGEKVTTLG
jgi:hypothetical protein